MGADLGRRLYHEDDAAPLPPQGIGYAPRRRAKYLSAKGGSSAGQSSGLIIRRSWVQAPPALPCSKPDLRSAGDDCHDRSTSRKGALIGQRKDAVQHLRHVNPVQGKRVAPFKVSNELVKRRIAPGEATEMKTKLDRPIPGHS